MRNMCDKPIIALLEMKEEKIENDFFFTLWKTRKYQIAIKRLIKLASNVFKMIWMLSQLVDLVVRLLGSQLISSFLA